MPRHLLLEGTIGSGKTSLLLTCLSQYANKMGGFCTRRIRSSDGKIQGFFLDIPSHASHPDYIGPDHPSPFLRLKKNRAQIDPMVLLHSPIATLRKQNPPCFLLDEIGGVELLYPNLFKELTKVLDGKIASIGVIKTEVNAKKLAAFIPQKNEYLNCYQEFRKTILKNRDVEILSSDTHTKLQLHNHIAQWCNQISK